MVGLESDRIVAALGRRLGDDPGVATLVRSVASIWSEIDASLSPVLGSRGVAMLYKRSLVLASATHGWLPRVEEALPVTVDLAPLQAALMQQGNTVALDGDPVRLAQVFVNLLDNASKYTPEGGVIELTVATTGNELVITVIDSGIGITTESMATMFDPFVQDPQAVAFNANGLGIGLTVVRELVDAHGGKVTAWSEGIGAGSRFTVSLPLGEDSRPADR